jgi:hypothetical protein
LAAAGGAFDPVTPSVAYLDYGAASDDRFVRLSDGGRDAEPLSDLTCTDVSLTFTTVARGLAQCNENDTAYSLRRTENGGVTWNRVNVPDD